MLIQINSGYRIGFDSRSEYSFADRSMGKSAIIFGVDMRSSVDIDNKNIDILILGEEPTQILDDTTLAAESKYFITFTESGKRFVLSLFFTS